MLKNGIFPKCLRVADLGCSSGGNTLLCMSNVIDTVHNMCKENKYESPEFQVYLNDLPDNDFNTVFKSIPSFLEKYGNCYIAGVAVSIGSLRSNPDPRSYDSCCLMDLLANSLLHLAAQGKIKEDKIDSFNIPSYAPYQEEIKKIVQMEGSFSLEKLETFETDMTAIDKPFEDIANLVVKTIRAVTEEKINDRQVASMYSMK
ncbi:hypothetical protein KY290_026806 [Solanum tuberosum]|uniref:Uncharacterized protein n=1 Tax=Solanum tuberosum TaxID=4113 RepID=A0ABQ7UXJ0_SOLTU|nr:hypothetical protein KY289_025025 [Solanum tuberosum]KAH0674687.1 hypothetical protein KY284_025774 [Solanum tuberosum]KAH0751859.1 hypothetical protein KY285_005007 [Solanum tuberosum]KAH0756536.1 hypothetical protein KY290_026806 [Solanum tuberosum]